MFLTLRSLLSGLFLCGACFLAAGSVRADDTKNQEPAACSASRVEKVTPSQTLNDVTLRYLREMVDNNATIVSCFSEKGRTYAYKGFITDWQTLTSLERRILNNHAALADPVIREAYEKIVATLDSVQSQKSVGSNVPGKVLLQFADNTTFPVPAQFTTRSKFGTGEENTYEDYVPPQKITHACMLSLKKILSSGGGKSGPANDK